MAYLEISGTIIHPNDIAGIEEKRVVVKATAQVDNPRPKPKKGVLAKLLYSDTIEETVELNYTVVVLKVKKGTQITTNIDEDTGSVNNRSHQLYDFYAVCNDGEFLKALSCASNRKDVELDIGNFYCYPGMLAYSDYVKTNVFIDKDICTKKDFIAKYIDNTFVATESTAFADVVNDKIVQSVPSSNSSNKYRCEIYVHTKAEGGRHTPFFSNYRPQFRFNNFEATGIITLPEDVEFCAPGDKVCATVELMSAQKLKTGDTFVVVEGRKKDEKTVGSGSVVGIAE